ncbi:MAG TPA: hypothetical protein VG796_01840 [Verrucomicrobiales bacterium]|nr:hypothetical protein [Verrucomicrobiales bacterium]
MKLSHFALAGLFLLFGAGIYLTMKTEMDGQVEQLKADNERKFQQWEKAQKEQTALLAKATEAMKEKAEGTAPATAPVKPKAPEALTNPAELASTKPAKPAAAPSGEDPSAADLLPPARPKELSELTEPQLIEKERDLVSGAGVNDSRMLLEDGKITGALPEGKKLSKNQSIVLALPAVARIKNSKNEAFVVLDRGSDINLAKGQKYAVRRGTFVIGNVTIGETVEPDQCVADVNKVITGAELQEGDEIIKLTPGLE